VPTSSGILDVIGTCRRAIRHFRQRRTSAIMVLLSIDPGYDKTGYAVFESDHPSNIDFIASGLIKTSKTHSSPSPPMCIALTPD
jgi:hypothetical protein